MPNATSSPSEPVDIAGIGSRSVSPSRIIEPLPNCLSICVNAAASALSLLPLSSIILISLYLNSQLKPGSVSKAVVGFPLILSLLSP